MPNIRLCAKLAFYSSSWELTHKPATGLIRLKMYEEGNLLIDSGDVYDTALNGGRLGLYVFSQVFMTTKKEQGTPVRDVLVLTSRVLHQSIKPTNV